MAAATAAALGLVFYEGMQITQGQTASAEQVKVLTAQIKDVQANGTKDIYKLNRINEAYALEPYFCKHQNTADLSASDANATSKNGVIYLHVACGIGTKDGQNYDLIFDRLNGQLQLVGNGIQ